MVCKGGGGGVGEQEESAVTWGGKMASPMCVRLACGHEISTSAAHPYLYGFDPATSGCSVRRLWSLWSLEARAHPYIPT